MRGGGQPGAEGAAAQGFRPEDGGEPRHAGRVRRAGQHAVDRPEELCGSPASGPLCRGETIDPKRLDSAESEVRALLYREGDVVPLQKAAAERKAAG